MRSKVLAPPPSVSLMRSNNREQRGLRRSVESRPCSGGGSVRLPPQLTQEDEIIAFVKALCFIEDAFRCICFLDLCKSCSQAHCCSSIHEWNAIVNLSIVLNDENRLGQQQFTDTVIELFVNLYKTFCETNRVQVMEWVGIKLRAHVLFFRNISTLISIEYDLRHGFSVIWNPRLAVRRIEKLEFEYNDPEPHFLVPAKFLEMHPQFGPRHPLSVRLWDFVGSKTHVEVLLGTLNLLNEVCPSCQTVEVDRFNTNQQSYPVGYLRCVVIQPSLLSSGTELAFPYQSRWHNVADFPCISCKKVPGFPKWILDSLDFASLVDDFVESKTLSNIEVMELVELLVFTLDRRLDKQIISHHSIDLESLKCAVIASVNFMMNCFPLEIDFAIPSLICGRVLGKIIHMSCSDQFQSDHFSESITIQQFNNSISKDVLQPFHLLFRSPGKFSDICPQDLQSLKAALSSSISMKLIMNLSDDCESCIARKILLFQPNESASKRFVRQAIEDVAFAKQNPVLQSEEIVMLILCLISNSSMHPLHADWSRFLYLHSNILGVKFESVYTFSHLDSLNSSNFPQSDWDLTPFLRLISTQFCSILISVETLRLFGGNVMFLLSKISCLSPACTLNRRISEIVNTVPQVKSHFESLFNGLYCKNDFFEDEKNEDELNDFTYWCIANSNIIGVDWIKQLSLSKFDVGSAFGVDQGEPLNFWIILVSISSLTMDQQVSIGGDVYDVLDFTSAYVVPVLKNLMSSNLMSLRNHLSNILTMTHIIYALTDYGQLAFPKEDENSSFLDKLYRYFCQCLKVPIEIHFIEALCEIYRT